MSKTLDVIQEEKLPKNKQDSRVIAVIDEQFQAKFPGSAELRHFAHFAELQNIVTPTINHLFR